MNLLDILLCHSKCCNHGSDQTQGIYCRLLMKGCGQIFRFAHAIINPDNWLIWITKVQITDYCIFKTYTLIVATTMIINDRKI